MFIDRSFLPSAFSFHFKGCLTSLFCKGCFACFFLAGMFMNGSFKTKPFVLNIQINHLALPTFLISTKKGNDTQYKQTCLKFYIFYWISKYSCHHVTKQLIKGNLPWGNGYQGRLVDYYNWLVSLRPYLVLYICGPIEKLN